MAPNTTYDPHEFHAAVMKCVDFQGVRTTARKLDWHPGKVSRARDGFRGLSLWEIVQLAEAVHAVVRFSLPQEHHLTPRYRGRPPDLLSHLPSPAH